MRITQDDWVHPCHGVYTWGLRAAPIHLVGIDICPYCKEPCPRLQAEIDACACAMLKQDTVVKIDSDDVTIR